MGDGVMQQGQMRHGDPPEASTKERDSSGTLTQQSRPHRRIQDQNRQNRMSEARIALAPMATRSSMIALTSPRGTSARTATQSGSASGAIVGDSKPGVIEVASSSTERGQS